MSNHQSDDLSQTPRSSQFLNQWASMLSMMHASGTSTPLNEALVSYYGATQANLLQQQLQHCTAPSSINTTASTFTASNNTTSPVADFAENPPLFTCTYCPYIAMDATSLEEHERQQHQREMRDAIFDSSSNDSNAEEKVSSMVDPISRQLLFGFNSPTKKVETELGSPNMSDSSRQFGRALQPGQITQMQKLEQISSVSPLTTFDTKPNVQTISPPIAPGAEKKPAKKAVKNRKGQFKCEFCDKVFGYQQNLNQHRRMHTGEKYKCEVCFKEFNFSQNLHQHMRVHSGKKEYKCSFCCKEFNDAANFHRHKRVIHGITGKSKNENPKNVTANPHPHMKQTDPEDDIAVSMPFTCPRCAMCFVLDSSLQKHLQHCVSPRKDEPDESSSSSKNGSPKQQQVSSSEGSTVVIKQEEDKKTSGGKNNSSGTKRKRVSNESTVSKRSRLSTENQENANEFQSCVYSQSPAEYPSCSGMKMPLQVQPNASPATAAYPNHSPVYHTPSPAAPAPQNQSWNGSSPGSSPTAPPSTGYIFVCPYCGFGVTNNLVFREHLMHHRESICHQYQRILSQGQTSFEVMVNRIMISCMQLINPTAVASPLSSSGSHPESVTSPVASPTAETHGKQLYNSPGDPSSASGYNMIPDFIQNPSLLHQQQQQQYNPYQAFMHPAYLNHQQYPVPQPNMRNYPYQQHFSPPGNVKQEMNDSGCIVEGEVSPWRLMMDRNDDSSFRIRQYNH